MFSFINQLFRPKTKTFKKSRSRRSFRPGFELLEMREVLSTMAVMPSVPVPSDLMPKVQGGAQPQLVAVNQPAPAAALPSSVPTNLIDYTPNTVFKLGNYWIDVPASYDPTHQTPAELFVWSHGWGGTSEYDIRDVAATAGGPTYIAVALDGREGGGWDMNTDPAVVLAAIADVKTHFNIDPQQVVLGGYSSGGDLSYRVAFTASTQIAGVLAENTSPFRDTGLTQDEALAAPFHFHVVHLAHTEDNTYPIDGVRSETAAVKAAGLAGDGWASLDLIEQPGAHYDDQTVNDLNIYLLPHLGDGWTSPGPADGGQQDNGPALIQPATADHPVVTGNQVGLSITGVSAHGEKTLIYTWTKTAGPDGVTFSVNGSNAAKNTTATFSQPGAYTFQATVTDVNGKTVTSSVSVTVVQAPAFTSDASTTFTVGRAGSFTVTASGFPAPTLSKFEIIPFIVGGGALPGGLPAGVTFNAATGVLSGTPLAGTEGTYTFHFTATNSAGNASQTFTLTVAPAVVPLNTLSQLQHDHGFFFSGHYYQNYLGLNEKWFEDRDNQWYVVQPNGQLSRWNGGTSLTQIATVDPTVSANPELLFQAPVTLSVQAQAQLSQLEQTNGFHCIGSYYQNWLGQNEKWFQDKNGSWFVVTTDGQVRPYTSAGLGNAVATVDPTVWDNPDRLFAAGLSQAGQGQLSQLQDLYGFRFRGDYSQSYGGLNAKWFQDRSNNWYALFSDGSLKSWKSVNGQDSFTAVAALDPSVYADPQLLFQAPVMLSQQTLTQLGQLEQANGFHFVGNYYQNYMGQNEKWFQDNSGQWFVATTDGQIRPWAGGGLSDAIATVDPAVWDNPDLLFGA